MRNSGGLNVSDFVPAWFYLCVAQGVGLLVV